MVYSGLQVPAFSQKFFQIQRIHLLPLLLQVHSQAQKWHACVRLCFDGRAPDLFEATRNMENSCYSLPQNTFLIAPSAYANGLILPYAYYTHLQ